MWHGNAPFWYPSRGLVNRARVGWQRGTSRPLLSHLSGLWAWESGCSRGPSQPTPRAPGAGQACPPDPAEARIRHRSGAAPACPLLCACLWLVATRQAPSQVPAGAPAHPTCLPPHPCTHSCVPAHLVTLGRPSADALLPPCSSSRPGHRRAAYSALALIQRRLGRRQRRPPQHPASSCDEYFEDAGLSTQFNTPPGQVVLVLVLLLVLCSLSRSSG